MRTAKTDQTRQMPSLSWGFTGRTVILFVLSSGGSYAFYKLFTMFTREYIFKVFAADLTTNLVRNHVRVFWFLVYKIIKFQENVFSEVTFRTLVIEYRNLKAGNGYIKLCAELCFITLPIEHDPWFAQAGVVDCVWNKMLSIINFVSSGGSRGGSGVCWNLPLGQIISLWWGSFGKVGHIDLIEPLSKFEPLSKNPGTTLILHPDAE